MTRLHTPFLFLTAVSPLPAAHQATARGNKYFYGIIKYFLLMSVHFFYIKIVLNSVVTNDNTTNVMSVMNLNFPCIFFRLQRNLIPFRSENGIN